MMQVAQQPPPHPTYTGRPGGGATVDVSPGLYRLWAHGRDLGPRDHVTGHVTIPRRRGKGGPIAS